MRKALGFTSLMIASVALMLIVGPSCKAEDKPAEEGSGVKQAANAMPIQVVATPAKVKIHVQRMQENIFVTPPNVRICFESYCDGNGFRWEVVGGLRDGETLTIKDAPEHLSCFPEAIPVAIQDPADGAESGLPDESCLQDKYGTYWPYVIEMKLADGTKFSTDPGGIIHKRR